MTPAAHSCGSLLKAWEILKVDDGGFPKEVEVPV